MEVICFAQDVSHTISGSLVRSNNGFTPAEVKVFAFRTGGLYEDYFPVCAKIEKKTPGITSERNCFVGKRRLERPTPTSRT